MDMLIEVLVILAKVTCIYGGVIGIAALTTLAERKVSAWIQYRHGPNRVGPFGILQPLADGVKFIFKEELVPDGANKLMFLLAPTLAAMPAMMGIAVLPFAAQSPFYGDSANPLSIGNPDLSVLFISGHASGAVPSGGDAAHVDFLAKPFRPAELLRRVQGLLERRHRATG